MKAKKRKSTKKSKVPRVRLPKQGMTLAQEVFLASLQYPLPWWSKPLRALKWAAAPFLFLAYKVKEIGVAVWTYFICNRVMWSIVAIAGLAVSALAAVAYTLGLLFVVCQPHWLTMSFQRGMTTYEASFFEFFPAWDNLPLLGLVEAFFLGLAFLVLIGLAVFIHWSITKWFPDNWQRVKETLGLED